MGTEVGYGDGGRIWGRRLDMGTEVVFGDGGWIWERRSYLGTEEMSRIDISSLLQLLKSRIRIILKLGHRRLFWKYNH